MRSFLVLALVGPLGFLVGCGSSNNTPTPVGVPVTIALTPSSTFVNAGKSVNIVLSTDSSGKGVTWALSPSSGLGTFSKQTPTSATYIAPNSVGSDSLVTVTATSIASSTVSASLHIPVLPAGAASDVQPISVSGGLLSNPIYLNGAFTSVTICAPNTPSCQTIDNILVDTGSFGLRILASQITIPLQPLADSSGNTLNNCVQFADNSYLWGLVEPADVVLAGEVANTTSIQSIANPPAGTYTIPALCSTGGTGINEDTQATLGANGILGVGPEPFDCGTICDPGAGGSPPDLPYFLCSSTSCTTAFVSCGTLCGDSTPDQQMTNPVFNFAADNNGVVLELPALPASGVAPTVDGNMIFGIGTQSNNGLGSATVFTLDLNGNFTTTFNGQVLTSSFIDSGSNGLFFPAGSPTNLTVCPSPNSSWYCPTSIQNLVATNGASSNVNFSVDNFDTVTTNNPNDAAFGNVAGPFPLGFDWGLPFFYGRTVFTALDGTTVGNIPGPFWAY